MFKCLDCGAEFDAPKKGAEYRGERHGEPCYEDMSYCPEPYCKSSNLDEGTLCRICDEFISLSEDDACGCCMRCVESSYSYQTGLEYLNVCRLEDEFMKWLFDIEFYKKTFLKEGPLSEAENNKEPQGIYISLTFNDFQDKLKEFCLEDKTDFAAIL